ncbi:MAG: hypothetical protein IMZ71_00055 [Chloroflexi bacterium]|nr:hypothetical protein [Chloroflexota bacterium]
MAAPAHPWEIFDYPCGGRPKSLLIQEVNRLRAFGELPIPNAVATQLKRMNECNSFCQRLISVPLISQPNVLRLTRAPLRFKYAKTVNASG